MTAYICSDPNCGWISADKDQARILGMKCFWCRKTLEQINTPFNRSVKLTDKEQRDDTLLRRLLGYGGGMNLASLKKTKLITSIRLLQGYAENRQKAVDDILGMLNGYKTEIKDASLWELYKLRKREREPILNE